MALLNTIRKVLIQILTIFLSTMMVLFGYPLLIVGLFPCWICKQLAVKLAQKDFKLGKVLEGIDGAFAGQDPYLDPLIVLMPYYSLAGKLDVPTVVKVLKEKVIEPKLYPELTQKIVRKYGYHFWYSADNFKVENHVSYLTPECPNMPITRTQLTDTLNNKVGKLPFDSTLSPWEIFVVPNMIDDRDSEVKSVFILRVNHCLMDGYSIANFLKKVSFKPWKKLGGEKQEEQQKHTHKFVEIYKFLMLLIVGPYYYLKMFVFSNDNHQFVEKACNSDFEAIYNSQYTSAISDIRLKAVKNAYGVTMSSLIATLFGQATFQFMRRSEYQVPHILHGLLSFPVPGHRDVLYIHWSLVKIPIKVNETDPIKTLKLVEKEFQILRSSVKPLVFLYANKLISLIPLWFRPSLKSLTPTTFVLSNFPGPTEPTDIFGCMLKHIGIGGKPSPGIPFVHISLSLVGKFWLNTSGPVCSLPTQLDADILTESIRDTLKQLEAGIRFYSN